MDRYSLEQLAESRNKLWACLTVMRLSDWWTAFLVTNQHSAHETEKLVKLMS